MSGLSAGLDAFLSATTLPTPFLVLDRAEVARAYRRIVSAFPDAALLYAVKACPHPDVLKVLASLGAGFDVASPGEIELALAAGAVPADLCFGNPIRSARDVATAHAAGVRRFVTDSAEDLAVLATHAPGARVLVRLLVSDAGSATPFGAKFGASAEETRRLLVAARRAGLHPEGVAFHVGSQQRDPAAYARAATAALQTAGAAGLRTPVLDAGGGLPVPYRTPVPGPRAFAAALRGAVDAAVEVGTVEGAQILLEPGRAVVAAAGVLRAGVVRVSLRPGVDERRWVYLDVGRYSGLAETEGEAIAYPLRVPGRAGPTAPVVLAGPTCDGDDVLYRDTPYELPVDLRAGDVVDLLSAGAYTASYSSVGFNGVPPLAVHLL